MSHHVDPELARVLRLDTRVAERPGEDVPANEAPLELYCLVPIPCVPNIQVQGSQPTAKTCMGHPEDGGPSGREESGKVTSYSHLLVLGFPTPASFLKVSTPGRGTTLKSRIAWLGICLNDEMEEGEGMRHKPYVLGQAHATLNSNQEEEYPEGLCCHSNQNGA